MRVFDDDPALSWLFVLPHPDDEIAISDWILHLVKQSNPVRLLWLHSTPIRAREAVLAASEFGLTDRSLMIHAFPDGSFVDHLDKLAAVIRVELDEFRPDRVVVPAFEQGHLDHDASNFCVRRSYSGVLLEYPMYHTYLHRIQQLNRFAATEGQEIRPVDESGWILKKRLTEVYRSQTFRRNVLWYEIAHRLMLKSARLGHDERMRVHQWNDFFRPQLPERLANRVVRSRPWKRWIEAIQGFEEHHDF